MNDNEIIKLAIRSAIKEFVSLVKIYRHIFHLKDYLNAIQCIKKNLLELKSRLPGVSQEDLKKAEDVFFAQVLVHTYISYFLTRAESDKYGKRFFGPNVALQPEDGNLIKEFLKEIFGDDWERYYISDDERFDELFNAINEIADLPKEGICR